MTDISGRPSTPTLLAEAMGQMSRLFETEIRLVRTELGEKVAEVIRALATIIFSAVILLAALVLILQGVVHLLIYFGLQPYAAFFAVGVGAALIGLIAVFIAVRHLKPAELAPNRSINQLSKDARVIKEQVT